MCVFLMESRKREDIEKIIANENILTLKVYPSS